MNYHDLCTLVEDLEPIFLTHREAAVRHVSNLGSWGRMLGKDPDTYVMTLRPYIIHPDDWDWQQSWRHTAHELVHWIRQPTGWFAQKAWLVRYGVCQKFRATEEMHAHLMDLETGRYPPDIPAMVEMMREWYGLNRVEPEWMVDWLNRRYRRAPVGYR